MARLGDGWLASAYNSTPEDFARAAQSLGTQPGRPGGPSGPEGGLPNALATMWTFVTGQRSQAERVLTEIIAPLVRRDPAELRSRICVGPASECADLLSRYARAGCQRVLFWPMGDEQRQIELIAADILPQVSAGA